MSKREDLYKKLRTISDDDYLTSACDTWLDSEEKIEEMVKAFNEGGLKTNDDVLIKILELEYNKDVMKK